MKRNSNLWAAVMLAAVIVFVSSSLTSYAGKLYDVTDLDGTYVYNLVEIRNDETAPAIDYCDQYGEFIAFGDGTAVNSGTRKCSISGTVTESRDFTYVVNPDGEVLITEVGEVYPTRAKLVNKGSMLLIDGTTRPAGILIMHGVAVKE